MLATYVCNRGRDNCQDVGHIRLQQRERQLSGCWPHTSATEGETTVEMLATYVCNRGRDNCHCTAQNRPASCCSDDDAKSVYSSIRGRPHVNENLKFTYLFQLCRLFILQQSLLNNTREATTNFIFLIKCSLIKLLAVKRLSQRHWLRFWFHPINGSEHGVSTTPDHMWWNWTLC